MGMFDMIKVEMKIPGYSTIPDEEFQTKSLDNCMDHYVITNKGELYREVWDHEWIDNPNTPMGGSFNKVEGSYRREYLTDYHGDIIFYTSKPMTEDRVWRDYTARFTEGKLTRIWFEDKQY
jgi:hypothetical protein